MNEIGQALAIKTTWRLLGDQNRTLAMDSDASTYLAQWTELLKQNRKQPLTDSGCCLKEGAPEKHQSTAGQKLSERAPNLLDNEQQRKQQMESIHQGQSRPTLVLPPSQRSDVRVSADFYHGGVYQHQVMSAHQSEAVYHSRPGTQKSQMIAHLSVRQQRAQLKTQQFREQRSQVFHKNHNIIRDSPLIRLEADLGRFKPPTRSRATKKARRHIYIVIPKLQISYRYFSINLFIC